MILFGTCVCLNNYRLTGRIKNSRVVPCTLHSMFPRDNILNCYNIVSKPGNWHWYDLQTLFRFHGYSFVYVCFYMYSFLCLFIHVKFSVVLSHLLNLWTKSPQSRYNSSTQKNSLQLPVYSRIFTYLLGKKLLHLLPSLIPDNDWSDLHLHYIFSFGGNIIEMKLYSIQSFEFGIFHSA